MSLRDDFDTVGPTPEEEVQAAYDGSAANDFNGERMRAWTIARQSAAMSLGVSVIRAIGPDHSSFLKTGTYPNILRDVIICCWLCSLTDEAVMKVNCAPGAADVVKAFEWAKAKRVEYGSPVFLEGVRLIDKIVREVLASFYSLDPSVQAQQKKRNEYSPSWQIQIAHAAAQASRHAAEFIINHVPMARAIQWSAMHKIIKGWPVNFSKKAAAREEQKEIEEILNG